jgi:dTDP-glucose 4,6-dehydratase
LQISSGQRRIKLGALRPTRDFNYVQDTVDGFLAVASAKGVEGEVINLGTGFDISIEEVARLIAGMMGVQIEFDLQEERLRPAKSEVERLQASSEKALQMTGWAPRFGGREGLERGLALTIDWFTRKENLNKYKSTYYNI